MLTVHRGTALEHFQRYTSRFKSLEFRECRQRLLTGDLAGAFPRSFRARVLFLNNTSIHIHTLTLDHTWELQSTITPGC